MVALDVVAGTELLGGAASTDDETKHRLRQALTRSLVDEGISYDLITTLEEVFADRPQAARKRRIDDVLVRMGLPIPRRQLPKTAPPLSDHDTRRITDHFRRATHQLVRVAPHRTEWYPTEELTRLRALRDERPLAGEELRYLRRYAIAIVALLELMGDDQ